MTLNLCSLANSSKNDLHVNSLWMKLLYFIVLMHVCICVWIQCIALMLLFLWAATFRSHWISCEIMTEEQYPYQEWGRKRGHLRFLLLTLLFPIAVLKINASRELGSPSRPSDVFWYLWHDYCLILGFFNYFPQNNMIAELIQKKLADQVIIFLSFIVRWYVLMGNHSCFSIMICWFHCLQSSMHSTTTTTFSATRVLPAKENHIAQKGWKVSWLRKAHKPCSTQSLSIFPGPGPCCIL